MIAGSHPSSARICIVEDDTQVLQAMTAFLSGAGFRVRGVSTGKEFFEFWEWSKDISCIVSDVRLPDIDGLDLLRELRKMGVAAPVILITGHGDISMAVAAMKAGASDFIEKPLDAQQLRLAIEQAIANRSAPSNQDQLRSEASRKIEAMSERQKEILALVTQGLTSKEIGNILKLSFRTVESHRASIMDQLGAKSLADLIRLSILAGNMVEGRPPGDEH